MKYLTERQKQAAESAGTDFDSGRFHCAEAVASGVLKAMGRESDEVLAQATAFGGGYGRTHCEACGALSGGLIAIGHLHGRRNPGTNWDLPAKLAAELRHEFVMDFGTTCCATLRERFGSEAQTEECGKIVQKTAATLIRLLCENRIGE